MSRDEPPPPSGEVERLIERLNEPWSRIDGAAARKINRILEERKEAASTLSRLSGENERQNLQLIGAVKIEADLKAECERLRGERDEADADGVKAWAEVHTLRAASQGPPGYTTWKDAAVAERLARTRSEALLEGARGALEIIAQGTLDMFPPFRGFGVETAKEIAREALRALTDK